MVFGAIGFTAPWLLLALGALPVLWLLLRAVPPAPIKRRFPGVALLLGLKDAETVSDRTPWWLLLLRMLAVASIIIGLAGPVLNPEAEQAEGDGPLLFVLDGSWAGATRWPQQQEAIEAQLTRASRLGRTVGFLTLTRPEAPVFQSADVWRTRLAGLSPAPWQPSMDMLSRAEQALAGVGDFDTVWFSDTIEYAGRDALIEMLQQRGTVEAYQTAANVLAILPPAYEDGAVQLRVLRAIAGEEREVVIQAQGRDPAGNGRILATATATFASDETEAQTAIVLPSELRARITRFDIAGQRSAGASTLSDDGLRRREVALISARESREGLELLSPLHYIEQALAPTADLLDGSLSDVLPANPDVIVLADIATLGEAEAAPLTEWIENGGMLVRFAGPRIAASDISRIDEDPLMPVRLRAGGRSVGGAMSWGEPKALSPFANGSPFFGLDVPADVTVSAQVMAQPDPTLSERVIAALSDGTPLVTRKNVGQGQIVLFHVTATAEWSTLPLSGLFVGMMERLAVSSSAASATTAALEGTTWIPRRILDGFGTLSDAGTLPGVDGPALVEEPTGPLLPPGLYASGDRTLARNVLTPDSTLSPATWPSDVSVRGLAVTPEQPVAGLLLSFAILLLLADVVVSLSLSGRLLGRSNAAAAVLGALLITGAPVDAQNSSPQITADEFALAAVSELTLGHIITGDARVDEIALAGLTGLSDTLFFRTSVEPSAPMRVNLETDELAFFPILYWPITAQQPMPSADAYVKLNNYLRSGGMILFDTRDADTASFGASSPNGRKLQELAASLDIPALEPLPEDHVITRTFYLLQDFPGRHNSRDVWVEASDPNVEQVEGMPFRDLNDGVTPVVIGGNDWASAWAVNSGGGPLLPVGRGFSGDRQREIAYRFGINLVMHVLTGNYKSDQVHVPALLDRLGQ
ncbi:N-terminal double-transmembrane domain protein [Sulfitobacter guttiformis KCTC 32187]|nr:N-terminal double-transmembrane domain protein [Sulfitobacter guttiformis KCTC 32187]